MLDGIKSGLIHQLWPELPLIKLTPQLGQGHRKGRLKISEFRLQISLPQLAGSEAEGQKLGAAGRVTVY